MKKTVLLICGILFSTAIWAQATVKGRVYNDLNQNSKKDRREDGIPNVAVTNGVQVVLTDAKGRYTLPIGKDQIISVIKPAQYAVPVDEDFLPQFYYIHKPEGSPESEFPGVAPTGKLSRSVDFGLVSSVESEVFSAVVFGDPQPYNLQEVDYFAKGIVSDFRKQGKVPFGISLGDLVGNNLDLFNPYIQAIKNAGIPWYNLLGNHDLNFDTEEDRLTDETFEAHFGPANYAFNYGKVHFIVLDDILYPDPRDAKGYWGGFREDQLQFVENDLKHVPKDHLVVLAFHIPISEPGVGDAFRDEDRERLFRALKDFPHTLSLSAHTHLQRQDFVGEDHGWLQEKPHHHYNVGTTSGDWYSGRLDENNIPLSTMRDGTPKGYAFLNFNGNEYSIDYKVAGQDSEQRMEIFMPKVVAHGKNTKAGIYVNYYLGGDRDSLQLRVDGGEWKTMKKVEAPDPAYTYEVFKWDTAEELMPGRRSSNPVPSTHLWHASIPTKLDPGEHLVEVKVKDMYGRIFTETTSYRLEVPAALETPELKESSK